MSDNAVELAKSGKWIGFGLDKTLAKFDGEPGCEIIDQIGEPIQNMVKFINDLHKEGYIIKIVTSRVAPVLCGETHAEGCSCGHCEEEANDLPIFQEPYLSQLGPDGKSFKKTATLFIHEWCDKHLGFRPEVVCSIDKNIVGLYSYRVTETMNDGETMRNAMKRLMDSNRFLENHYHRNERKKELGFMKFMMGMFLASFIYIGNEIYHDSKKTERYQAETKMMDAIREYINSKDSEQSTKNLTVEHEFVPGTGLNCTGSVGNVGCCCQKCEKKVQHATSGIRVRQGRRPVDTKVIL